MAKTVPIPTDIMSRIQTWLDGPYDEATKAEIRTKLERDPQSLIDGFFTDLSFGTGGLRGLMGIGTNRLNRYTIQIATQGLANYLLQQKKEKLSVFIGFDSRHHSQEFAKEAACVLAGNGIHVYLLPELRPTPYISFGCRHLQCDAGIMMTASHNPKEYNGYKVYGSDGAQLVHPHDTGVMNEVAKIKTLAQVHQAQLDDSHIEEADFALLDQAYLDAIRPLQHFPKDNKAQGENLGIAYTSLHGTGITIVPKALNDWGFTSIHDVASQIILDGNFPTVHFPNPEYPEALALGVEEMVKTQADILIANDPDADRIGIVAMHQGKPIPLNGNEVAAICTDYLCTVGQTSPKSAFVTTIVTTELIKAICDAHHLSCFEVLTGFKYIGEKIHQWEQEKDSYQFIFGAEESYGYLLGTHARDKDAIIISCLIAEIALHAKQKQLTLVDQLHQIYRQYGIYREKQHSLDFKPGKEGMEKMGKLMHNLRINLPKAIGKLAIVGIEDYETSKGISGLNSSHQKEYPLVLPKSDVLLLRLEDQTRLVIRPSGTEPKVKIYSSTHLPAPEKIADGIAQCDAKLELLVKGLENALSSS